MCNVTFQGTHSAWTHRLQQQPRVCVQDSTGVSSHGLCRALLKRSYGHVFNVRRVDNLRRTWNISRFDPVSALADGELINIAQVARVLSVATNMYRPSLAQRRIHGGRADHERCFLAHPHHVLLPPPVHGRGAARLHLDVRGYATALRDRQDEGDSSLRCRTFTFLFWDHTTRCCGHRQPHHPGVTDPSPRRAGSRLDEEATAARPHVANRDRVFETGSAVMGGLTCSHSLRACSIVHRHGAPVPGHS